MVWLRPNLLLVFVCLFLHSEALPQTVNPTFRSKQKVEEVGAEESPDEARASTGEPSCHELRMMWQYSKRQSRTPEITNEIPTYRDPFSINVWDDYARPRSAGRVKLPHPRKLVFGKVVSLPKTPQRIRAFQDIVANREWTMNTVRRPNNFHRHSGGGAPLQPLSQGSFQHLKELIRNERARELQEQRMSDEADRVGGKDATKYPYGRLNDSPPAVDNVIIRNKPAVGSRRMAGYPVDMLMAPRYFEDYPFPNQHVAMNKYKPQFPDTSLVTDRESQWAW